MGDNANIDNELAALTDRLLNGEDVSVSENVQDLAEVVRQLQQVIQPDRPPDPVFQERLTQRLKQEWSQRQHVRHTRPRWRTNHFVRWGALAAAVLGVVLVIGLLFGGVGDDPAQGTAAGSLDLVVAVIVLGVVLVGGIMIFWWQQRHKP